MRRILAAAAILIAAVVCGCASSRQAAPRRPALEQVAVSNEDDFGRLWSVALEVVGERFAISSAEETSGTIATDYLVGSLSETGFRVNAASGRERLYDTLHTTRRRALVTLWRKSDAAMEVRVDRERLVRVRPNPFPSGTYSLDRDRSPEAAGPERWVEEGRDGELEAVIAREIASRYRAGAS